MGVSVRGWVQGFDDHDENINFLINKKYHILRKEKAIGVKKDEMKFMGKESKDAAKRDAPTHARAHAPVLSHKRIPFLLENLGVNFRAFVQYQECYGSTSATVLLYYVRYIE